SFEVGSGAQRRCFMIQGEGTVWRRAFLACAVVAGCNGAPAAPAVGQRATTVATADEAEEVDEVDLGDATSVAEQVDPTGPPVSIEAELAAVPAGGILELHRQRICGFTVDHSVVLIGHGAVVVACDSSPAPVTGQPNLKAG